jgi:hypothetical protein
MIVFHLDLWAGLGFIVQFILPLLVALVTTRVTSGNLKALLLGALTLLVSVVSSVLTAHDTGATLDLFQTILTALAGFVISVGGHFGLWKPTGLADILAAVGVKSSTSQNVLAQAIPSVADLPEVPTSIYVPAPAAAKLAAAPDPTVTPPVAPAPIYSGGTTPLTPGS